MSPAGNPIHPCTCLISRLPIRLSIDHDLEEKMELAQNISSMVLGLRRKVNIKVRQPLRKIMVPVSDPESISRFEAIKHLILNEVNVKELEYLKDTSGILVKKIKPNFKVLGPRYGKLMKEITRALEAFGQEDISRFEAAGNWNHVGRRQADPAFG